MTGMQKLVAVIGTSVALSGCASWDNLSRTQKDTAVGAAAGGVIGGLATDSALGTLGGAAVGGVVGHEVGKRREPR